MNEVLRRLLTSLEEEERQFLPEIKSDHLGLLLRVTINELDWFHYNMEQAEHPTSEQQEHSYLLRLGAARLIKLSLESIPAFDAPTLTVRRRPDWSKRALETAAGLGMIEHGRRVAQTVRIGIGRIEEMAPDNFQVTLPPVVVDDEYHEREVTEHYNRESRRRFSELMRSKLGKKLERKARKLLIRLVRPFQGHFIGYDADPFLDVHFFGVASHEIQLYRGYDTFHYAIRFGGVPFQKYILALTYLISLFRKHEGFAEALIEKEPGIHLENVLTISSDTEGLVESIKDAINWFGPHMEGFAPASLEEARQIFEVLSVSRKNTDLLNRPGGPLPMLIQCSDQAVVRCLAGAGPECIQFLLNSLRRRFPDDYSRNQRMREGSLQRAVKRVLNGCFENLEYRENIKVRLDGRELTDIDLAVLEKATGTVFFLQLKHQELYGADLHAKEIRASRLKDETSRWLEALKNWFEILGEAGLRSSLRISKDFPPVRLRHVIVSRHHAQSVRDLVDAPTMGYATWDQFFNAAELLKQKKPSGRQLDDLFPIFRLHDATTSLREHEPEPRTNWILRKLRFTVCQEDGAAQERPL